jgi:hypothetical protein
MLLILAGQVMTPAQPGGRSPGRTGYWWQNKLRKLPNKRYNFGELGGYDIILVKLNAAGNDLVGSIKIGGKENDGVNIRSKYSNPLELKVFAGIMATIPEAK